MTIDLFDPLAVEAGVLRHPCGAEVIKVLDIDAVKRVVKKRKDRGASNADLLVYLERLKSGAWKRYPEDIDKLIAELNKCVKCGSDMIF